MISRQLRLAPLCAMVSLLIAGDAIATKEIVRPEEIRSMREVVYDRDTYDRLARMWQEYHEEFPSGDAYGNWMYAARYAGHDDYRKLLDKGLGKYPDNPILLYLAGMKMHGKHDWSVGLDYLERAAKLDPTFSDPWFSLVVHYMDKDDDEKTDLALRRLLESGSIADEILDYGYNMLTPLAADAILICNGDNDTYPAWILTRLLDHRPDVVVVNRSLLNTTWYPEYLIEHGLPRFVDLHDLDELHAELLAKIEADDKGMPPGGPFSDALIERLVRTAAGEGRPVYLAVTLTSSATVDGLREQGRLLGLATLATPPTREHAADLSDLLEIWLARFRTGGIDSWRLHHQRAPTASHNLMLNYAGTLLRMMDDISRHAPRLRLDLFRWYREHVLPLLDATERGYFDPIWCKLQEYDEIRSWCTHRG